MYTLPKLRTAAICFVVFTCSIFRSQKYLYSFEPNQVLQKNLANKQQQKPIPTCMVFLHIPKSGGRSVSSFLRAVSLDLMNFTEQRTYGRDNVHLRVSDLQVNHTITFGHFTTLLFEKQPQFRQCFTITVLREPVDRAISAFFYHGHRKNQIGQCLDRAMMANTTMNAGHNLRNRHEELNNITASDPRGKWRRFQYRMSQMCRADWQYSNDMTRRLAGSGEVKWNTRAENKTYVPQPNITHLENAKQKLVDEFDLTCYINDLSSCADRVLEAFHLDRTDEKLSYGLSHMTAKVDPRFKTASRPDELDEHDIEKFRWANELDIEFYNWAVNNVY